MHKVITFGIPSYNAAKDMDHCITSILEGSNYATDIEIIVVDDGSKDETADKADEWEARYPGIIRAVHQENGGHGIAVLSGLRSYMMGYFTMMMAICSVLTKLSEEDCADERLKTLWNDLKAYDERMYRRARYGVVGFFTNLRGRAGDKTTLGLYRLASKIFKFN